MGIWNDFEVKAKGNCEDGKRDNAGYLQLVDGSELQILSKQRSSDVFTIDKIERQTILVMDEYVSG